MNYRRLGKSGLKISVISYGFWAMFSSQPDVDLALACLTAVYDAGCNYFDNAEVYGNGQSELLMGVALKKAGWSRDSYIVSSMEADSVVCQYNLIPTMLGRRWEKGQELSGGQWQKIALSRAFMRKAEVLVLDEPTSALDAEAEYEVFRRFGELIKGRIAVLISHRFSTVRMADRIVVLSASKIVELGSHAELIELDGVYARLFNLQAEGYR